MLHLKDVIIVLGLLSPVVWYLRQHIHIIVLEFITIKPQYSLIE